MLPRIALFLALILAGSTVMAEEQAPVVAVFEIQSRGSTLTDDDLKALTDYLGTKLGEGGHYQIIPRQEIKKRLLEQKKASYKQCYEKSCQIDVGREMAAQFTVSASISRVGKTCIITSAMYDLKKAATYKTGTAKAPCKADELLDAVELIAVKLSGGQVSPDEAAPEPVVKTPDPAPKLPPEVIRAPRKFRKRTKSVLAAALWSALPGGGMYYVGKWGWGIFYTSVIIGGYVLLFSTMDVTSSDTEWMAPTGGMMIGLGWLASIIHSMVAAADWKDPQAEQAGLIRDFRPIPAIGPGRDPHPAVIFSIFSGRF